MSHFEHLPVGLLPARSTWVYVSTFPLDVKWLLALPGERIRDPGRGTAAIGFQLRVPRVDSRERTPFFGAKKLKDEGGWVDREKESTYNKRDLKP